MIPIALLVFHPAHASGKAKLSKTIVSTILQKFNSPVNFDKARWLLYINAFKKSCRLSLAGPEIAAFRRHSFANFRLILN